MWGNILTHIGMHHTLWVPQPPVVDAALEEFLKARHKRSNTFHVV
jgi:hypothetical protein